MLLWKVLKTNRVEKNVLLRSIIGTLPQFVAEDGEDEIMLSVFLYIFSTEFSIVGRIKITIEVIKY